MYFARSFARSFASLLSSRASTTPLFLQTCLTLALTGCSFHAHSEFHTGKGGSNSAGAENQAASQPHEHTGDTPHEGRHSSAGRDNVVRVTSPGSSKPAVEQGSGAQEPARTTAHSTGDVPPSSSGSGAGGSSTGGAAGEPTAVPPKQAASTPVVEAPAAGSASDAPAGDEASSTGKGTLKNPSEPHVAVPTKKPRKVHRTGESSSTKKEGGHE